MPQTGRSSIAAVRPRITADSIRTFPTARRYLYDHIDLERMRLNKGCEDAFKLDRTRQLLDELGNPHDQIRTVHIAGSKGKGSTVAMLSAALQGCGVAVGAYTSPHLVDLRERIKTNDRMISHRDFTFGIRRIANIAQKLKIDGDLHFFEITTVLALLHFAEQAVDLAIIETGLGGRLDCTNVINPEVTLITQISYDHVNILGDTLELIAAEKAGIFKPGVPAISAPQLPEVDAVLCKRAKKVGAKLRRIGTEIGFTSRFEACHDSTPRAHIGLSNPRHVAEHVPVPLAGEHQATNCALALATVDMLNKSRSFTLSMSSAIEGLKDTTLEGRMEIISRNPCVLIDGAHNAASMEALIRSIGAVQKGDSLVVIFGCGKDKDVDGMLRTIALGVDKVIFTQAIGNPRAMEPADLQSRFNEIALREMSQTADTLEEAIKLAGKAITNNDLICITGSFYLVGEAKKLALHHAKSQKNN